MNFINYVNLDVDTGYYNAIKLKQNDSARSILVKLQRKGEDYTCPSSNVRAFIKQEDNTLFYINAIANNNTVTVNLTNQILNQSGALQIELVFYEDDKTISTFVFKCRVEGSISDTEAIESSEQFSALTDAMSTIDDLEKVIDSIDDIDYLDNKNNYINVLYPPLADEGCVGDGTTDDTDRFKKLVQKYNNIFIPSDANLYITSPISLSSNTTITGSGTITIGGNSMVAFKLVEVSNIIINGIQAIGFDTDRTNKYLAMSQRSSNIKILNNTLINCGSIATVQPYDDYEYDDISSYDELSSGILISNNKLTNDFSIYSTSIGVLLQYAYNCIVTNNTIDGFLHGVQCWGGNSNPSINGSVTNTKWCKNITVANNIVTNSNQGGIWGSMVENYKISNNYIENCGDVGIDFEGCRYSSANNNTVINCTNANLAIFFYSEDIDFINNKVINTGITLNNAICRTFFKTWNSSLVSSTITINIKNNTFYYNNYSDDLLGTMTGDPSMCMNIENNVFRNVAINFNTGNSNNGCKHISNNRFFIDKTLTSNTDSIINISKTNLVESTSVEDGGCYIENNNIQSRYALINNVAINVIQNDYNVSLLTVINNNTISKFSTKSIRIEGSSSNESVVPRFILMNNICSNITDNSTSATVIKKNNISFSGTEL